jgi:leucine-rich repeat protein SHOC2
LPSELGMLASLELLDLSSNILSDLPTELVNLQSLEYLDLAANALSSREVFVVQNLTAENLTGSDLLDGIPTDDFLFGTNATTWNYTVVVSSVPRLSPSLRILDLSLNELAVLPTEIGSLVALEWLFVNNNQLTKLPSEVGLLKSLDRLNLRNNSLSSLPTEVGNLENLSFLDVSRNVLPDLPDGFGNLVELMHLDVSYNEMVVTWSPESIEISNLVANLETCSSDYGKCFDLGFALLLPLAILTLRRLHLKSLPAPEMSSCEFFCCRLDSAFCEQGC